MKRITLTITLLAVLVIASCDMVEETPEGPRLTPEASKQIDDGIVIAEGVGTTAVTIGTFYPPAAGIGGIILGLVAAARRLKPKIEAAETNAKLAGAVAEALVETIEDFKVNKPSEWSDALKPHLMANLDHEIEVEINRIKDR